ncbi:hypothetical protein [Burkholderia plantarii]|uniref:hypothetical protein n=1 Tax=Burkholderia plantarii TaxID=41899 RepID=UPI0011DFABDF|nr:hypothetical protein [Burkholderia plantarii]
MKITEVRALPTRGWQLSWIISASAGQHAHEAHRQRARAAGERETGEQQRAEAHLADRQHQPVGAAGGAAETSTVATAQAGVGRADHEQGRKRGRQVERAAGLRDGAGPPWPTPQPFEQAGHDRDGGPVISDESHFRIPIFDWDAVLFKRPNESSGKTKTRPRFRISDQNWYNK